MTSTPYVPNIIEALQRRTAYQVAQRAPDGMVFRDVTGELVIRKRTAGRFPLRRGRHSPPAVFVYAYPPAVRPSKAKILEMLA